MLLRLAAAVIIMLAVHAPASGGKRSTAAKHEFQRETPCPSTGARRGGCPGYVIDHVAPICAGGLDHPSNMQWQTIRDAKAKDREEVRTCRALRR